MPLSNCKLTHVVKMNFELLNSNLPFCLNWNYANHSKNLIQLRKEEVSYPAIIEYLRALAKIYLTSKNDRKTVVVNEKINIFGYKSEYFKFFLFCIR